MAYNEDEQLEEIKRFWNDYGTALLLAATLVLAGFAGWKMWTKSKMDTAAIASNSFQDMTQAAAKLQSNPDDKASNTELQSKGQKLLTDYANTPFATNAALLLAKRAVDTGDLKGAAKQLQWVIDQKGGDAGLKAIATVRLARVKAAQGDSAGALSLLNGLTDSAFVPLVSEAKGDIYEAQNKPDDARKAYQAADAALAQRGDPASPLLAMKMAGVGVTPQDRPDDNKAAAQ